MHARATYKRSEQIALHLWWWMLVFTGVIKSSQFHFSARWLLRKQDAQNSHPFCTHWFPGSSQAIYSQAEWVVKVQPSGTPTVCGSSEKPAGGAVFSQNSGSFLSSLSSSHTFLVAWGDPGSAWSSRYIPVANTRLLIMVIEETRQLSWPSWMGDWMPCNSHSL